MPAIGNVVYEATFDATESNGRMEQPGRGSLRAGKRHDVNQAFIEVDKRRANQESALRLFYMTDCGSLAICA